MTRLKIIRPPARPVVYAKNLYDITVDAVWHEKWSLRHDKLTGSLDASKPAALRESGELFVHSLGYGLYDAFCC